MKSTMPMPTVHEIVRNTVRRVGRRQRQRQRGPCAGGSGGSGGGDWGGRSVISLGDDREIPAAAFSLAAVGVEDRALATRAESGVEHAAGGESALAQQAGGHRRQIDVRLRM